MHKSVSALVRRKQSNSLLNYMLNVVPKISVILTVLQLVFRLCHTGSASWNWGWLSDTRRLIGVLIGHITTEPDVSYILYQYNITFFPHVLC